MLWKQRKDIRAYLLIEALIFVAIKIAQYTLTRNETRFVMYAAIVVNTIMALRLFTRYGKAAPDKHDNLIFCALMVNCLADIFLTLIGGPTVFLPGFACFCTVEAIYAAYLRPSTRNLIIRAAAFIASLVFAYSIHLLTLTNALGLLNLTLIGGNAICAWLAWRRERTFPALLFAVGLTSFLIGDISVALEIMLPVGTLAQRLFTLAVWTFYTPAQVLIVLTYAERLCPSKAAA